MPLEAVDDDHLTWDSFSMLDDADDEIDLPGPGVYDYTISLYWTSLQSTHDSRFCRVYLYCGDGGVTNTVNTPDDWFHAGNAGVHTSTISGKFTATNDAPFVYLNTFCYFGGGRNLQEGFFFINRKSD
jgi:hypothetical protein